ncbi:DUF4249 domain-containing protein [Compostibacter hankyongensis]
MQKWLVISCGILVFFASCEKDIDIPLHETQPELVVEGSIENGRPPIVILTHSLSFFDGLDSQQLASSFVHDATVEVTDGQQRTVSLKEYSLDTTNGNKVYFYSIDTTDRQPLLGIRGGSYRLHIRTGGQTYEATTDIPEQGIYLDSLWWQPVVVVKPEDTDRVYLTGRLVDPPHRGDAVRYFTRRNNEPFYAPSISVADDQVTNGSVFDIAFDQGRPKDDPSDDDEPGYFRLGDTVTVKFCAIDRATYDFWRTWEYAYGNNGNPFSAPVKILGNIKGAAGYWGGYAAQYKTIIIPKEE